MLPVEIDAFVIYALIIHYSRQISRFKISLVAIRNVGGDHKLSQSWPQFLMHDFICTAAPRVVLKEMKLNLSVHLH